MNSKICALACDLRNLMGSRISHPSDSAVYANGFHKNHHHQEMKKNNEKINNDGRSCFQMPLHYPRYKKSDYEKMHEWQLDLLLKEYGLPVTGDVNQKRKFAIGAFLWPPENDH